MTTTMPVVRSESGRPIDEADDWVCTCGNRPDLSGFYACDLAGGYVEPTPEEWNGYAYVCADCGAIIDGRDGAQIGLRPSLGQALEASRENIADGGGTVEEHAARIERDYGLAREDAIARLAGTPRTTGDCFCCGHGREDHEDEAGAIGPCNAELFSVGEEVLTDCPCGAFIDTPEGATR